MATPLAAFNHINYTSGGGETIPVAGFSHINFASRRGEGYNHPSGCFQPLSTLYQKGGRIQPFLWLL